MPLNLRCIFLPAKHRISDHVCRNSIPIEEKENDNDHLRDKEIQQILTGPHE